MFVARAMQLCLERTVDAAEASAWGSQGGTAIREGTTGEARTAGGASTDVRYCPSIFVGCCGNGIQACETLTLYQVRHLALIITLWITHALYCD